MERRNIGLQKTKQNKYEGFAHIAIKLLESYQVSKILIAISHSCEIRHVDIASAVGAINGILLDYTVILHMFTKYHLFFSYYYSNY